MISEIFAMDLSSLTFACSLGHVLFMTFYRCIFQALICKVHDIIFCYQNFSRGLIF